MANKTISQLTAKTTLATTDVFPVEDTEDTKKVTLPNLAKAVVETYNGSTLAGTAQSVKAAIDGLNSDAAGLKTVYKGSLAASGTGASVSITGAGTHCIYLVAVGTWNQSRLLVVYPGNGGDVRVKPLSWYANSDTAPSDIVTITAGSGTSGITIANASSNACPLTVFAIVKSN